jgi:hypothetical protein
MVKSGYLGFLIFVSMMIVFFILPDLKGLQKPFRILLGLLFAIIYFALLIKEEISLKTLWPVLIGGLLVIFIIFKGTFQAALFNAYLCLLGLLCIPHLFFDLTPIRRTNLIYIYVFCVISFLIQFLFFSSVDGRPSLAYQFNAAGAYLFLFFILSDILNIKLGKLFVFVLSLVMLCRLLIFSIIIFYLIRYFKEYFKAWLSRLNATSIIIVSYIVFTLFSLWYVANVKVEKSNRISIGRISTLNDESNQMRFLANDLVIGTIYAAPLNGKVLFGFGQVENFLNTTKENEPVIMPHNELFDAIVEFGIISVIFFSLFSLPIFNKVTSYSNIEYLIPILFHTLILWVRFLFVPSFEMIFILFILCIANEKNKSVATS